MNQKGIDMPILEVLFYLSLLFTFVYLIYLTKRIKRTNKIDGWDIVMLAPVVNLVLCFIGISLVLLSKLVNTEWEIKPKKNEKSR